VEGTAMPEQVLKSPPKKLN